METPEKKSIPSSFVGELVDSLQRRFTKESVSRDVVSGEVTLEIPTDDLLPVCRALRDEPMFGFKQLVDLCGIDYARYGVTDWKSDTGPESFSRGVAPNISVQKVKRRIETRFAVVYHLLSHSNNDRLRVRTYLSGDPPKLDSVVDIWSSANWFEREAFDLFGILFEGHPDLRRILTDYGFVGYPLRKDFPLAGKVEVRYDPEKERVIHEPVSIKSRTVIPRVIRNRTA
uniref:NADH-quinone oxidoreductase subunit C n=1 Tax=Candidatus Kentrum sp. SD TaxID=2126332 RepID=A0A450YGG2_9GAMM|nr:MAG: NADH dehydrogenase subunit C [Candidatus Kentron sp. SD]VFK40638.1 MAG: NADH dehydrogenase subunit C [Candidatus Kentron sp. SD]VFK78017.1 MAG: NADH dehydrogenase subunit C [Candidatus Kentron sp. SD]